jgi:hypothetical protein
MLPFARQASVQMPPLQKLLQQVTPLEHGPVLGVQGVRHTPLLQVPLQHSSFSVQMPPSGVQAPQVCPQMVDTAATHSGAQASKQHPGNSPEQMACTHGPQSGDRGAPTSHSSCEHASPPQTPPPQTKLQHSLGSSHSEPLRAQPPHTPPAQTRLQH